MRNQIFPIEIRERYYKRRMWENSCKELKRIRSWIYHFKKFRKKKEMKKFDNWRINKLSIFLKILKLKKMRI